jgi:hypothetical protein
MHMCIEVIYGLLINSRFYCLNILLKKVTLYLNKICNTGRFLQRELIYYTFKYLARVLILKSNLKFNSIAQEINRLSEDIINLYIYISQSKHVRIN